MSTERAAQLAKYNEGLQSLVREKKIDPNRAELLVEHTAKMLWHFFDTGEYGDPESCNLETLPAYWPYVRYLVFDALKPKFGAGEAEFVDCEYDDKFLTDIVREAKAIAGSLPENLTNDEWRFMAAVSAYMIMESPFLVDKGFISRQGQINFRSQSMIAMVAFIDGVDYYEHMLRKFKESWQIQR